MYIHVEKKIKLVNNLAFNIMGKNIKHHVQHLRSRVVDVSGKPKLPSSDDLLFGEIAINYHEGAETISFKNDSENTENNIITLEPIIRHIKSEIGTSTTDVMSQSATTKYLNEKVDLDDINNLVNSAITYDDNTKSAITQVVNEGLSSYTENVINPFSSSTSTSIEQLFDSLSAETENRISGDTELQELISGLTDALSNEVSARTQSDTELNDKIEGVIEGLSAETENRISANTEIYGELDTKSDIGHTHIKNDITDLNLDEYATLEYINTNINDLVASAITSSDVVIDAVNSAVTASIDSAVSGKVDTETFENAISGLTTALNDETSARTQADNELSQRIVDETSARTSDVESLNNRIVGVDSKVDSLSDDVYEKMEVIAYSLNDLKDGKLDISAYTPTDLSEYYTKSETSGKTEISTAIDSIYESLSIKVGNYEFSAHASNNTSALHITNEEKVNLDSISGNIQTISAITSNDIINWNNKADASDINSISGDVESLTDSVETISGNVNSLSDSIETVSGNVNSLSDSVDAISGEVITFTSTIDAISGDVESLTENVETVSGNVNTISGSVSSLSDGVDAISGNVESLTENIGTISGSVNTISGLVQTAIDSTNFLSGHNTVNSLVNIPVTKRLVIATISSDSNNISLSGSLQDGQELHLIIHNISNNTISVTIPNTTPWIAITDFITIDGGGYGEINIVYDGTNLFVRGV